MSPDVSEETSDMPSRGSAFSTASGSGSWTIADDVVEPASTFWRLDGRRGVSSKSWPSSSNGSDDATDDNGDSGGVEWRAISSDRVKTLVVKGGLTGRGWVVKLQPTRKGERYWFIVL